MLIGRRLNDYQTAVVGRKLMWTPPCQQPKFNITKRKMRAYVRALVEKLSLAH